MESYLWRINQQKRGVTNMGGDASSKLTEGLDF